MINISRLYSNRQGLSDALRYPAHRDNRPIVVYNCTPQCNLRCIHCYANSDACGRGKQLSANEAKQLIDQVAAFGCPVLLFSGGEPLLRTDLFELMEYAAAKGMRIVLSSNGTLITARAAAKLAALNLSYAGISVDGPQPMHDRFRGRAGAFDDTMQGIANCIAQGIRTGLRFTMTANNCEQIESIFEIALKHGVKRICFYHLIRTGRAQELSAAVPSREQTIKAVNTIIDLTDRYVRDGLLEEVLTVGNHADGPWLLRRMRSERHSDCTNAYELLKRSAGNRVGQNIACINWDGQVFCDQFWRNYSLGNILETPFGRLWENEKDPVLHVLRNKDLFKAPECAPCKWYPICGGNFRSMTGKADIADWRNEPACYLSQQERESTD
ncbi:MAG: radical SAM protein [Planctomycetaceae bacterium]|nr:radical SAM protein [Planctomycetaceae bacterium]